MDIVQYLHGLVSSSLGVFDEDTNADLLKQYYALTLAHIANTHFHLHNTQSYSIEYLWGDTADSLIKRLARSFHQDEQRTATLLKSATPLIMVELSTLIGEQPAHRFISEHFHASVAHLPAWSAVFISIPPPKSEAAHTTDIHLDDNNTSDVATAITTPPPKPKKHPNRTSFVVLGSIAIVLACVGGGIWYINSQQTPSLEQNVIATPNLQSLNPPRIRITSGENASLYACQAEVGNSQLQTQLLQILQKTFPQISCIIDIDDNFGSSLIGLERLESILALLKAEPFSSIEIVGDKIFVNSPNVDTLRRLTADIGLLAPQFSVSSMPTLDKTAQILQSFDATKTALAALQSPPNGYELARAMSLMTLDFNGTNSLPTDSHELLTLIAQKISDNPTNKFIIVSHTDTSNPDRLANISLSQSQADSVRTFLIQQGVSESQLVAKGVGDTFPIADNMTELGKFKNRRTEFLVFDEPTLNALSVDLTSVVPIPTPTLPTPAPAPVTIEPMSATPVNPMPPPTPQTTYTSEPNNHTVVVEDDTYSPQASTPNHRHQTRQPQSPPPLPSDLIELSDSILYSENNNAQEIK